MPLLLKDLVRDVKREIEENSQSNNLSGIPSGLDKLDRLIYGWQNSELITIGGRPGMGKTSFALTMARNIAVDYNIPVKFFTIESSLQTIITKLISLETEFPIAKLKTSLLNPFIDCRFAVIFTLFLSTKEPKPL